MNWKIGTIIKKVTFQHWSGNLYEKLNLKENICFYRNDKHNEFYFVWFLTCQLYHSDIMSNIIYKVKV